MTAWQRFEITSRGIRLSILERPAAFPPTQPPILLLHGLVAESESFRALMSVLPDDRRILALDLPGAGYSEQPLHADVSLQGLADVVRDALPALALDHPVLLGHSHGGAVALRLATTTGLLDGLILLASAHPFARTETRLVRFYLCPVGRFLAPFIPRLPTPLLLWFLRRMPGRRTALRDQQFAPCFHTLRRPGTIPHILRLLETWETDMRQLAHDLEESPLPTPTLLLWGDRDIVVPPKSAAALLQHLQTAELFTLPGVGHLPNEESPTECATLIETWLSRRPLTTKN